MSTWRVWRHYSAPQEYEDITADTMFVSPSGYVQWLNRLPEAPVDPSTLCQKPIANDRLKTCVRVKTHKGDCKPVLGKSRFSPKPPMICVRMLANIDDLKLI